MHCWYIWHQNIWYIGSILSLRGIVLADKVSQLSVHDDVRVKIVPCEWCLIVPGWLVLTKASVVGGSGLFPVGWY